MNKETQDVISSVSKFRLAEKFLSARLGLHYHGKRKTDVMRSIKKRTIAGNDLYKTVSPFCVTGVLERQLIRGLKHPHLNAQILISINCSVMR